MSGAELRRLAWRLEPVADRMLVVPGMPDVEPDRITVRSVAGDPVLQVSPARLSGPSRLIKASFDRSAALIALSLVFPFVAGAALWIWAADRHSPLFRHERIGLQGRPFGLYKLAPWVPEAASRQAELMAESGSSALLFKFLGDPRITPIGRWLRRFSLDELPSCGMWCAGTCPWSVLGRRSPPRSPSTATTCGGGWSSSPESPACGRSVAAPTCRPPRPSGLDVRYVENWSLGAEPPHPVAHGRAP